MTDLRPTTRLAAAMHIARTSKKLYLAFGRKGYKVYNWEPFILQDSGTFPILHMRVTALA